MGGDNGEGESNGRTRYSDVSLGGVFKPCIAENGKLKFPVSARWLVKTITLSEMTKA